MVRDILHRSVPDRSIWAFGSRVTGKARCYSDLDLVVMGDRPLPPPLPACPERSLRRERSAFSGRCPGL